MDEFRATLNENGRIVIPSKLREILHIKPGDELILRRSDDGVVMTSAHHALHEAQHVVASYARGKKLTDALKHLRAADE